MKQLPPVEQVREEALQLVRNLQRTAVEDADWFQIEAVLDSDSHPHPSSEVEMLSGSSRALAKGRADTMVRYDEERLRAAILFIHQRLDEAIGVEDITRHLCVSRRWLEYAFRDAFGITPYQYLRRVRLERARRTLVTDPRKKVYQVALSTGFSSARQFTTSFRQFFGFSPSDCRRQGTYSESCSATAQS
jgi:transcriptional regulator GlxA family with amidase domain